MKSPKVSIIIPIEEITDYLRGSLVHLGNLDYPDFEVLVFITKGTTEKFPRTHFIVNPELAGCPAEKRDLALNYAKGEILAFIDDDAYPRKDWLKNAVGCFEDKKVAAVCGPGVTPPSDSISQKVSGWVQASKLGGGNCTCRFLPQKSRLVDDYPSMNFIVRKSDFEKVGGFDSHFWPGEDTKLCYDLVYDLGKKIIYDPEILVYHHRRPLFRPHLKQVGGYGLHRGHFARVLPKTSRRLSYFIPALFALFLFGVPVLNFLISASEASKFPNFGPPISNNPRVLGVAAGPLSYFWLLLVLPLTVYLILLLLTSIWVYRREKKISVALLTIPGIFTTHIWYGLRFIQGFFSKELKR